MQNGEQNWGTAGIAIASMATILAAAVSAGIFAVLTQQDKYPELTRWSAAVLATTSLVAYVFVLLFGMAALLRETQKARRTQAARCAAAVFVQGYAAVFAITLIIYFPLLERIRG